MPAGVPCRRCSQATIASMSTCPCELPFAQRQLHRAHEPRITIDGGGLAARQTSNKLPGPAASQDPITSSPPLLQNHPIVGARRVQGGRGIGWAFDEGYRGRSSQRPVLSPHVQGTSCRSSHAECRLASNGARGPAWCSADTVKWLEDSTRYAIPTDAVTRFIAREVALKSPCRSVEGRGRGLDTFLGRAASGT